MELEEKYATALLRELDDEPRTPSRVDLPRAITDGRRRRRVRRILHVSAAAAVTALAVASVPLVVDATAKPDRRAGPVTATGEPSRSAEPSKPAVPVPPTTCAVQRLPVPGGHPMSLVTGADPTGRFIVGRAYPNGHRGEYPLLIWDNGKGRAVAMPGADQSFSDITSTGVAVGAGWGSRGPAPYVYRDGVLRRLPGVATGTARAINEAGVIVGSRDVVGVSQPVIWRSATEPAVALPLPGKDWWGEAIAVAEDGTVLGTVHDRGDPRQGDRAYVWSPEGKGQFLPNPANSSMFRAFDMNGEWVTGLGESGKGQLFAVLLNRRTGKFTSLPGAVSMIPDAVSTAGWIAGSTVKGRAVMYAGQTVRTLPDYNNHRTSAANIAETISDDGRTIAGQGDDAKGVIQAVVWRCR